MTGLFTGVGVGPGDPELITLKAARLIRNADVISYIADIEGQSQAKKIATDVLLSTDKIQQEIPVLMPMCDDRKIANAVYDEAAKHIRQAVDAGKSVVFLCEGDPLFFGSFAYLLERLQASNHCQVIPGVSSFHAASAALQLPLTMLKESFAVISGRHSKEYLIAALKSHDSVVIMKAGRSRERILSALRSANRMSESNYVEYIGRDREYIQRDVGRLQAEAGPYFSLFVVTRKERGDTWAA